MSVRADVVDTGHKKRRAGKIIIHAPIQKIFDILADPYRHREFDEHHGSPGGIWVITGGATSFAPSIPPPRK